MPEFKIGKKALIIFAIIGVIVLIFAAWIVVAYNGLVSKQSNVEAQWAQVENQYRRKIDLIPELVNVTSQYTQFEANVLTNVTELRTKWLSAKTIPEQVNLSNLLNLQVSTLVATFEAYPELHSIGLVAGLFDELAGTENRITVERARFNDGVRSYNTQVRSFPDNIIAGWFGFKEFEYYDPIPGGP